jgi:hypothetical protein
MQRVGNQREDVLDGLVEVPAHFCQRGRVEGPYGPTYGSFTRWHPGGGGSEGLAFAGGTHMDFLPSVMPSSFDAQACESQPEDFSNTTKPWPKVSLYC